MQCKCCGNYALNYLGNLNFNKAGGDENRTVPLFPKSEWECAYYSCAVCGFIFTDFCDKWTPEDFKKYLYNDDYALCDPDILTGGRDNRCDWLAGLIPEPRGNVKVLDYGAAGNPGPLGKKMIEYGFDVSSYDPFYGESTLEDKTLGLYDVVFCIETIEHCADPKAIAKQLSSFLADDGLLLMTTDLFPPGIGPEVLNSAYITPRNGHISLFTLPAISILFRNYGVNIIQSVYSPFIVGFKKSLPKFKNNFFV